MEICRRRQVFAAADSFAQTIYERVLAGNRERGHLKLRPARDLVRDSWIRQIVWFFNSGFFSQCIVLINLLILYKGLL